MNLRERFFPRKHLLLERFKGKTPVDTRQVQLQQLGWMSKCEYYDRIYEQHPLAKSQILTLAGQLMAEGLFLKASGEYPQAEKAVDACLDFNRTVGMDTLLHGTAAGLGRYGSFFWERDPETMRVRRIIQQALVEPKAQDGEGNITSWHQVYYGLEKAAWTEEEIVHFGWDVNAYWPYGTSLLIGLDSTFEILEQLQRDIKEYTHKQAFPKHLWQVGDKDTPMTTADTNAVKTVIKNWEPGDEFVTNAPIDHKTGDTGATPMREIGVVLNFLKDQTIDGLMMPPISKQYSSTEASAKEMMRTSAANLVRPMQRMIARKIETEVYMPLLESQGFSVKVCPEVRWESPDATANEDADYYVKLVQAQILTPEIAAQELGFGDKLEMMEKQRQLRQQRQLELQAKQQEQKQEEQKPQAVGILQRKTEVEPKNESA